MVRRSLGNGRASKHRAALLAALWDGAAMDSRDAAFGADLHGYWLCADVALPRGRRCARRRVCDWRPRPYDFCCGGSDPVGLAGCSFSKGCLLRLGNPCVCLHDLGQRYRATRRPKNWRLLYRRYCPELSSFARLAHDGTAC